MHPELSPPSQIGRWSGWGWGMGYVGGMVALLLSLAALSVLHPWIALNHDESEPIRATFILTAVWYGFFLCLFFSLLLHPLPAKKISNSSLRKV